MASPPDDLGVPFRPNLQRDVLIDPTIDTLSLAAVERQTAVNPVAESQHDREAKAKLGVVGVPKKVEFHGHSDVGARGINENDLALLEGDNLASFFTRKIYGVECADDHSAPRRCPQNCAIMAQTHLAA